MQTVTIDILDVKAERLLDELGRQDLIRVRNEKHRAPSLINWTGSDTVKNLPANVEMKKLPKEWE